MNSEVRRTFWLRGASRTTVIRAYYAFQFFFTLLFWTPVFFEYQKRMGLSDPEIFRIQSLYYVAFCLFEIPTGYFADRFGYIRSMKLGAVALVVSNLIAVYVTNFEGFLLHWILIAAARSFVSGASSAYLYEYLRRTSGGKTEEFKQIEGNARAYSLFGRVLCFAIIGFLMEWKLTLPYWLTAASAAVSLGFAAALPGFLGKTDSSAVPGGAGKGSAQNLGAPTVGGSAQNLGSTPAGGSAQNLGAEEAPTPIPPSVRARQGLGAAFLQAIRSEWLLLLMFQGVVLFVLARIVTINLFQPILASKHFGLGAYGVVMAGMTLVEAVGAARPRWMRRWFSDLDSVCILSAIMGATALAIPFFAQYGTLLMFALFSLATGLSYPIQRQVMNDAIPDPDFRATILSLESLIDRAVTAVAAALLERLSHRMDGFLVVSGGLSVVFAIGVQVLIHRHLRAREASNES
jgi:MFS family permease